MARNEKSKGSILLSAGGIISIAAALAVLTFFVYLLVLRTEYRRVRLEINDRILNCPMSKCSLEQDGRQYPASKSVLDYYDQIILQDWVMVLNRSPAEPNEKSITIQLDDCSICFTGLKKDYEISVCWRTPEETRYYTITSAAFSYTQLNAYLHSYIKTCSAH